MRIGAMWAVMGLFLTNAIAVPCVAGSVGRSDPLDPYNAGVRSGLHFSDLEAAIPTDPFLWSADPGWKPHKTPAEILEPAHAALRMAVPLGMPASDALFVLERAGAKCFVSAVTELDCHYRDIETPMRGASGDPATDDVTWYVKIALIDGRAGHIDVARNWTRH